MIKVDLITGFLGSGKTTFLKKYAQYLIGKGERIGILENDFGAVNVDMLLLNELRGDMCELEMVAGGCDADCHRRRFKTKLISMAMSGYSRILIEPSGIFDVDEFFDVLREEPLENWYEIGNVFCVVDAGLEENLTPQESYMLASQAANAGVLVFSKTGMFGDERIKQSLNIINNSLEKVKKNSKSPGTCGSEKPIFDESNICTKDWQDLQDEDFEILSKAGYKLRDYIKSYKMDDVTFETRCFLNFHMDIEHLKSVCLSLFSSDECGHIFRIKGYVPAPKGFYQINATAENISVEEVLVGQEVLIVIGEDMPLAIPGLE